MFKLLTSWKSLPNIVVNFLWSHLLKPKDNFLISLGKLQKGSPVAILNPQLFWARLKFINKVSALIKMKWVVSESELQSAAHGVFVEDLFGEKEDYGDKLFILAEARSHLDWNLQSLKEKDIEKADALQAHAISTRQQFKGVETSPTLRLQLGLKCPELCEVILPMSVRVPVVGLKYFIDINAYVTFHEIRRSNHPQQDNIIADLYDILFTQHKTISSLFELLQASHDVSLNKAASVFIKSEADAIRNADLSIVYLKATIEKIISFIAAIHNLPATDSLKKHKQKTHLLDARLSAAIKSTPYANLIFQFIESDNFEQLNNFRTGIFHKKGCIKLQPHTFTKSENFSDLPLLDIFKFLHDQYVKNSLTLLGALALLTDELMRGASIEEKNTSLQFINSVLELQKSTISVKI